MLPVLRVWDTDVVSPPSLAYTLLIYNAILLPRPPVVPKWGRAKDSCEKPQVPEASVRLL